MESILRFGVIDKTTGNEVTAVCNIKARGTTGVINKANLIVNNFKHPEFVCPERYRWSVVYNKVEEDAEFVTYSAENGVRGKFVFDGERV